MEREELENLITDRIKPFERRIKKQESRIKKQESRIKKLHSVMLGKFLSSLCAKFTQNWCGYDD